MDAEYSGKPLVAKLGVKPGHRVALVGAPKGWELDDLPEGVRMSSRAPRKGSEGADVIVAFSSTSAALGRNVTRLAHRISPDGALWLAWPRRAAGHTSDITDNLVREIALPIGLVDVKVAAIGEDWSGLKLVWRKELRPR